MVPAQPQHSAKTSHVCVVLSLLCCLLLLMGCSNGVDIVEIPEVDDLNNDTNNDQNNDENNDTTCPERTQLCDGQCVTVDVFSCLDCLPCPGVPQANALSCSADFECTYECARGRGDANGDLSQDPTSDGCECIIANGGQEVCDGFDDDCDGLIDEGVQNVCGGCGELQDEPGQPCGAEECPGVWDCTDDGTQVVCQGDGENSTVNECGGCGSLRFSVGDPCGECGRYQCEGTDALVCVEEPKTFYRNNDGDDYGDTEDSAELCQADGPYTALLSGDCDDTNDNINPAAEEACNGIDDNCNGDIDEGAQNACGGCGELQGIPGTVCGQGACLGQWACNSDGSAVICEGDNNNGCGGCEPLEETLGQECGQCGRWACDGEESVVCEETLTQYFRDSDDDSFGVSGDSIMACEPEDNYRATRGGDCNDNDRNIRPNADELCNGTDENCNGTNDANDSNVLLERCDNVEGAVAVGCNSNGKCVYECQEGLADTNGDLNEDNSDGCDCQVVEEVCDGEDNDCDGQIDEGLGVAACENDQGLCLGAMSLTCDPQCDDTIYAEYIQNGGNVFEADFEATCDQADNNCDGQTDENCCPNNTDPNLIALRNEPNPTITQAQPQMLFHNSAGDMTVIWGQSPEGEREETRGMVYIAKLSRDGNALIAPQGFSTPPAQRRPLLEVKDDGTFIVTYLGPSSEIFATFFNDGAQWDAVPEPVSSGIVNVSQWDTAPHPLGVLLWMTNEVTNDNEDIPTNTASISVINDGVLSPSLTPKLEEAVYRNPKMVQTTDNRLLCGIQSSGSALNNESSYPLELYTQNAEVLNEGLISFGNPIDDVLDGQYALASLEGNKPLMVAYVQVVGNQRRLVTRAYDSDGTNPVQTNVDILDVPNTIGNLQLSIVDSHYLLTWAVGGNQSTLKAAWFDTNGNPIEGHPVIQNDFSIRGGYHLVRSPPREQGAPSWYALVQSGEEAGVNGIANSRAYLRQLTLDFDQKLCFDAP